MSGRVLSFVKMFLCVVVCFFILQTFLVHGLGLHSWSHGLSLAKDIVWFGFVGVLVVVYRKHLVGRLCRCWFGVLCVVVLLVLSVVSAGELSLFDWLVGVKYDWWYLVIVLSGMWVGYSVQFGVSNVQCPVEEETVVGCCASLPLHGLVKFVVLLIKWVLVAGVVWQMSKLLWPSFFVDVMGYGALGDFVPWAAPPLYYLTGPDGLVRLSGLFAGPNVLGFFLAGLGPLFLVSLRSKTMSNVECSMPNGAKIFWTVLLMVSVVWTMSRGAVVAFGVAGVLWVVFRDMIGKISLSRCARIPPSCVRRHFVRCLLKKVLRSGGVVVLVGVLVWVMGQWKTGSNSERMSGLSVGWELMQEQPWGHGPGFAGPARHYWDDYVSDEKHALSLVENVYLQVGVNLGWFGLVGWCAFWAWLLYRCVFFVFFVQGKQHHGMVLFALLCGVVGLLVEGMVLHVWRDSSVNYLVLVILGVVWGYLSVYDYFRKRS